MLSWNSIHNLCLAVFHKINQPFPRIGYPGQIYPVLGKDVVFFQHDPVDLPHFGEIFQAIFIVFILQIVTIRILKTLDVFAALFVPEKTRYGGEDFIFGVDPCCYFCRPAHKIAPYHALFDDIQPVADLPFLADDLIFGEGTALYSLDQKGLKTGTERVYGIQVEYDEQVFLNVLVCRHEIGRFSCLVKLLHKNNT